MASIETAYSLELNEEVDAIRANELWLEGVLTDKRAFECIDYTCRAKITCKNMDTLVHERKMKPHFIMANRENMHSSTCEVYKEYERKECLRLKNKKTKNEKSIGKKVCFRLERPETQKIVECIVEDIKVKDGSDEEKKSKLKGKRRSNNSNYYWLQSLIWYYINSYKDGTLNEDTVEIDFGKGRKYTYTLNKLFKRIRNVSEITEKDRNHYVYFGRAKIFFREDGGYDLVFYEQFLQSEKKVKCIISKKIVEQCQYGKKNKINILESNKGKERYIYVLATKNISEIYNTVYLNIENFDCVAISEIDLDKIDDIEYD